MPAAQLKYRNALIRVEADERQARLLIDNVQRAAGRVPARPGRLSLSSSLQTGYEWHELIEAVVNLSETGAGVTIRAGGRLLLEETLVLDQSAGD